MRYIDHPDDDLNPRGFRKESGKLKRVYGKSDPPPPPNYTAAAQATAQGNLEATRAATQANRINQYTPYGTLTYSQTPTGQYDYDAYNKALSDYNTSLSKWNSSGGRQSGGVINDALSGIMGHMLPPGSISQGYSGPQPVAPKLEDFQKYDPDSGWSQTMTLTPQAQAALDQQLALNQKYGEVANIGFDKARQIFENPQLDVGALPERAINVGQTAQEAILSRLNPQLQQQDEQLRTRLANQGITLGSDAYNRELNLQGQRANDLQMQAALQGINLDQANRSAALQEQAYLQDRPLNLINALRTGNQVQAPQFQQFAQQQTTAGPDLLGATNAQYNAAVQANNAENAATSGMMSGLLGVGMGIAGLPVAGVGGAAGGSLGGNALNGLFSDRRLKKNIKHVGKMDNGLNIYSYEYIWGGPTQIGVMAQEVEKINPDAVFEVNGYKAVKYDRL